MNDQTTPAPAKPLARLEFASRLRALRLQQGFRTARGFARTLNIDENRYTRYERAEVEPDLDLIQQICGVLNATPNDLLGVGQTRQRAADSPAGTATPPGFASPSAELMAAGSPEIEFQSIALELCRRVVAVRQVRAGGPTGQLDASQQVTPLHDALKAQPFEIIRQIVGDRAVIEAPADTARDIHDLILRLTHTITQIAMLPRVG